MDKPSVVNEEKQNKRFNFKNNLVLTIDQNEKIIKFNKSINNVLTEIK